MAEKDLEGRLSKVEEYIKNCEKNKDQKWKESLIKKLDEIREEIKSDIKSEVQSHSISSNKEMDFLNYLDKLRMHREYT